MLLLIFKQIHRPAQTITAENHTKQINAQEKKNQNYPLKHCRKKMLAAQ